MPVRRLKQYLDENQVKYVSIAHSIAYTAAEIAAAAHVSGRDFAKTVMVSLDDTMVMVVLRAVDKLDLHLLRSFTGANDARMASEEEFRGLFPAVHIGAMPPFGNLYGIPVYVDASLAKSESIAFNAGSHSEVVRLAWADYQRLVDPIVANFASDELTAAV